MKNLVVCVSFAHISCLVGHDEIMLSGNNMACTVDVVRYLGVSLCDSWLGKAE